MKSYFDNDSIFPICPQQDFIAKILSDYEVLEDLRYCLSDEDASKK